MNKIWLIILLYNSFCLGNSNIFMICCFIFIIFVIYLLKFLLLFVVCGIILLFLIIICEIKCIFVVFCIVLISIVWLYVLVKVLLYCNLVNLVLNNFLLKDIIVNKFGCFVNVMIWLFLINLLVFFNFYLLW